MKRTTLSHALRNSWFCLGLIMLLMSLAAQPAPINAQEQRLSADTLFRFVEQDIGLSGGEMGALKNGRVLTKRLDTNIKHEIAMFGIARIDVPASAFMIRYNQGALLHLSRSRIDALRDVPKLLARDLYKGSEGRGTLLTI